MPGQLTSTRWRWLWALVAIVIAAILVLWYQRREHRQVAFGCPEHDINLVAFETRITRIPIAPETGEIPEFHDCQRMKVGEQYGPLIAIWAAQDLKSFFPPLPDGGRDDVAYAVAQVLDMGNGPSAGQGSEDYAPLAIRRGFSCVYLWRTVAPDSFAARIVYQSTAAALNACAGRHQLDRTILDGQPLSVQVIRDRRVQAGAIPPVARWDQDPVGHDQYIGIRCGDAWCEIGPRDGFTSSQPAIAVPAIAGDVQAVYEKDAAYPVPDSRWPEMQLVKGWYDQQELEVWNASGQLEPSGVIGTIIPNPVLDVIGASSAATGPRFYHRWVPSAYIHVTGDYHGKQLQLKQGVSRLYLCKGYFGECQGVTATKSDADSMWSKLVAPGGSVTYHSVMYDEHGGGVIPAGAARWRWLETDGTTWIRCDDGCCTNR